MTHKLSLFPLMFALCLGCTRGDGVLKDDIRLSDQKEVFSSVNAVQHVGRLIVEVTQGDKHTVRVSAEGNMQAAIRTRVLNETLYISTTQDVSLSPSLPITVSVTMPSLQSLRTSGLTQLSVRGLNGSRLEAHITGDTVAMLKGELEDLSLEARGAARIDAADLNSDQVTLRVSGRAVIDVNPLERLDLIANEALVRYLEKPEKLEKSLRNKARLEKLDLQALKDARAAKTTKDIATTPKQTPKKGEGTKGDAIDRALGL